MYKTPILLQVLTMQPQKGDKGKRDRYFEKAQEIANKDRPVIGLRF